MLVEKILRRSDLNLDEMDIGDIETLAENGDAEAQYEFAKQLVLGKRITQNTLRGIYWLKKAAAQGIPEAQYCLGVYYFRGEGVPQDTFVACILWQLAAAQGHEKAKAALEKYFSNK